MKTTEMQQIIVKAHIAPVTPITDSEVVKIESIAEVNKFSIEDTIMPFIKCTYITYIRIKMHSVIITIAYS